MTTFKQLRELVTFKGGGTPSKQVPEYWNGDIPWATVKDFTSTSLSETQDSISQEGLRNSSANLIPKGHVIIPTRMSLGKAAINTVDLAINQDLRALVPKIPLDMRFLLHAVLSLKDEIVKKGAGATVKGITQDELYKLEIAFPPLDDQIRIAHLLGKVEGLIAQRKQHLQQLDDLLKGVFLEMFGDPVQNEKGWNVVYWDDLFVTRTGKLNANAMSESGAYPFFTCAKEAFHIDSFSFDCEALILAGNNATGDYDVKYYKGKFNAYQRTYILELKIDTDEYLFFKHHLEMKLRQLKDGSKGANTRYLTKQFLETIAFIQPGEEFQKKFSTISKMVVGVKSKYQKSLADLEALYGTLSQKAFKGELDLSRVPLPADQAPQIDPAPPPKGFVTPTEVLNRVVQFAPPESRSELLARWFNRYLANTSSDASLSSREFLESAWQTLQETRLESEGESPALTLADYDALKELIFAALEGGTVVQTFAEESNRVSLHRRSAEWGSF